MCLLIISSSISMQLFCFLCDFTKFESFTEAFMSMFQILTQEAWVEVMDETMLRTRPTLAPLVAVYFILYHLFVTLVNIFQKSSVRFYFLKILWILTSKVSKMLIMSSLHSYIRFLLFLTTKIFRQISLLFFQMSDRSLYKCNQNTKFSISKKYIVVI